MLGVFGLQRDNSVMGFQGTSGQARSAESRSHLQTLIIYKLGLNQIHYAFTLILLINIVLCSKFSSTQFINYKRFDMRWGMRPTAEGP